MPKKKDVSEHGYEFPVKPLHSPLTPDDEAMLNAIQARHDIAEDFINRVHDTGIDMTAQLAQLNAQKQFVGKVKQRFFPAQIPTGSQ